MVGNLQGLPGAAVYTLDYRSVAERWFTQPGAGGTAFLDAARCLVKDPAFGEHQLIVVAHSMGGLITRWAVNTDDQLRQRTSLVLTLGTPYDGSWLATVGTLLLDTATVVAKLDPKLSRLLGLVHLLVLGCAGHDDTPGCGELNELLRNTASVHAFAFGSSELQDLKPWPAGIQVKTFAGRIVLENAPAELFAGVPVPGDLDLGDGVVDVNSAGAGKEPTKVGECRYTASSLRASVDGLLGAIGQKANLDQRQYVPLVAAIFGASQTTCGHVGESRLVQLTNEVVGTVADELSKDEPTYAYTTTKELWVVRGTKVTATVAAAFDQYADIRGPQFTDDRRFVVAVSKQHIIAVDLNDNTHRSIGCDGCFSTVPLGGAAIGWLDSHDRLIRLDLANPSAKPAAAPLRLPQRPPADVAGLVLPPRLLASGHGLALIAIPNQPSAYGGPEDLYLIDPNGSVTPLGTTESNIATLHGAISADGATIAYASGWHSGVCYETYDVSIVDARTRSARTIKNNLLGASSPADGAGVSDLWFDRDGALNAIYSNWRCTPDQQQTYVTQDSMWTVAGDHWRKIDAGPILAVRQLTPHTKAVIANLDPTHQTGTLYTQTDQQGTKITTGVFAIAAR